MIPTYEEVMLPLLEYISDSQNHTFSETVEALVDHFKLTDYELKELLPSGTQPIFKNRVGWARTYMKKAGLLTSPKRAHLRITERGLDLLKEKPVKLDSKFLLRYPDFVDFQSIKRTKKDDKPIDEIETITDRTPEETLDYAYQKLKSDIAKEVLDIIKDPSASFFEKLVIDLFVKMGYGGSRIDAGQAFG